jgi:hypothetical protein
MDKTPKMSAIQITTGVLWAIIVGVCAFLAVLWL